MNRESSCEPEAAKYEMRHSSAIGTRYEIKAVLFDFGETLVNFGKVSTTRLFRQGARLSYDFLKSMRQPVGNFNYYCWRNLVALHIRRWLSNITKRDFDALVLLRGIGTKKGIRLDKEQWQHLEWLWYEPLAKVAEVESNIAETLAALKNLGIKLGIISNTFVNKSSLEKHLNQLGILEFFTVRVYSYKFDFRKPDVRIFKVAAERIGEKLENIMFVGDRIGTDIKPAMKAGMQAVLKAAYTNAGRAVPDGVTEINHLSELPPLIQKINAQTPH